MRKSNHCKVRSKWKVNGYCMQQEIFLARTQILFIWDHLYFLLLQCNHTRFFMQLTLECHAYLCIPSICISNRKYVTYKKLSLHQKTWWYLLVSPTVLLKPLALVLPSYLTALYVFQKSWALSCFDCGGETEYQLSNLLFFPSLKPVIFYSWPPLLVKRKKKNAWLGKKQKKMTYFISFGKIFYMDMAM